VSRYFEVNTKVSCEESTANPRTGLIFIFFSASLFLTASAHEGMARLSGLEWLVTCENVRVVGNLAWFIVTTMCEMLANSKVMSAIDMHLIKDNLLTYLQ